MNGIEIIWTVINHINAYIWQGLPGILKALISALVFVLVFRKQIKAHPVVFYLYPTLYLIWGIVRKIGETLNPSGFYESLGGDGSWVWNIYYWAEELGLGVMFGIALIIIVMFIGVLPQNKLVKNLFTIRTEMSIIGATILMGHGIAYFPTSVTDMDTMGIILYIILGPVILALLVIPWITSFRIIRNRMKAGTWKKLQTYLGIPLFVGMLVFGFILNLLWSVDYPFMDAWEVTTSPWDDSVPISLGEGVMHAEQLVATKIYLVLLVSYIILRIKKYKKNNAAATNLSETNSRTQEDT